MNRLRHIVVKDARRLAGPLVLWLLLVLAQPGLLLLWEAGPGLSPAEIEARRYFLNTCGVIVQTIGFILASWLVMEDSLVSSRAFWPTRPISGLRLLVAKLVAAVLLFSVLPAVVLTPCWLGCGFSLREVAHAATDFGVRQLVISLAAFALASVTETSGQFLVRLVAAVIGLPLFSAFVLGGFASNGAASAGLSATRSLLVSGLLLLTPAVLIVHQFLTRRTARSWLIFGVGMALMVPAGRWWPWEFGAKPPAAAAVAGGRGPVITADRVADEPLNSLNKRAPVRLEGRVTGLAAGTHVRVDFVKAWWLDATGARPGPGFSGLTANGRPSPGAIRHAVGLAAPLTGEVRWEASGGESLEMLQALRTARGNRTATDQGSAPAGGWLRGEVTATVLHGAVLGELPLRVGASLQAGSSFTRISALTWDDGRLIIQIEERDAWTTAQGVYSGSYNPRDRRVRPVEDGFVVLNRRLGFDQLPDMSEVGTMKVASVMWGLRNLVVTPPAADGDWLEDAVLVKARFSPGEKITRPLAGDPSL